MGDEEGGGEAGGGDSEGDGHLLAGAGDGAGGAGLLLGGVGVDQGVHAGVLEGGETSVEEAQREDEPERGVLANGREGHQQEADKDGVRDEDIAVAEVADDAGGGGLDGHRAESLRHDEQAGLHGGIAEAELIEQRQKERDAADAEAGEEASADGRRGRCGS